MAQMLKILNKQLLLIISNSATFPHFLRFTKRYRFIHSMMRWKINYLLF